MKIMFTWEELGVCVSYRSTLFSLTLEEISFVLLQFCLVIGFYKPDFTLIVWKDNLMQVLASMFLDC